MNKISNKACVYYCRDEELREARSKIHHLCEELGAVKQQTREDYESSMRTLQREISEVQNRKLSVLSYSFLPLISVLVQNIPL